MATVIQRLCDTDQRHGVASEFRLALNGREVSVDLCAKCEETLMMTVSPYLAMGRVVRGGKVSTGIRPDGTPSTMSRTPCPVCNEPKGNQGLATHIRAHISHGEYTQEQWDAVKRQSSMVRITDDKGRRVSNKAEAVKAATLSKPTSNGKPPAKAVKR